MEEIPYFFAFLNQSHFLLATAPLTGTELSHSWCFIYPQSRVQVLCLTYCQGTVELRSLKLYVPSSQLGHPSFLFPWTLGAWNGHFSWGFASSCGLPPNRPWPWSSKIALSFFQSISSLRGAFSTSQVLFPDLAFLIQIDLDGLKLSAKIISTKYKFPFPWG